MTDETKVNHEDIVDNVVYWINRSMNSIQDTIDTYSDETFCTGRGDDWHIDDCEKYRKEQLASYQQQMDCWQLIKDAVIHYVWTGSEAYLPHETFPEEWKKEVSDDDN